MCVSMSYRISIVTPSPTDTGPTGTLFWIVVTSRRGAADADKTAAAAGATAGLTAGGAIACANAATVAYVAALPQTTSMTGRLSGRQLSNCDSEANWPEVAWCGTA